MEYNLPAEASVMTSGLFISWYITSEIGVDGAWLEDG